MKKRINLGLILGLLVLYFYLLKQYSFNEIYPQADDISTSLEAFRKEPVQNLEYHNQN
jgi:hypothetical protein